MNKLLQKTADSFIRLFYFCDEVYQSLKLILVVSIRAFVILFSISRITTLFIPSIIISTPILFLVPFSYISLFAIAFTFNTSLPSFIIDPLTDLTEVVVRIIYQTIRDTIPPLTIILKKAIYLALLVNNLQTTFVLLRYIVYFAITIIFFSRLQHLSDDTKQANARKFVIFNPDQSTHYTSVNNSVKASIDRLRKRYPNTPIPNHQYLSELIKKFLDNAPRDLNKRAACDRFLNAKLKNWYNFEHYGTTVPELLSIILVAVSDKKHCLCSKVDAAKFLQEALYQIQRGNAINEQGIDEKRMRDGNTCLNGILHKLIEQFVGLHPDFQLLYITKPAASAKVPSTIANVLREYLQVLPSYQARAIITNIVSTKEISDDLYKLLLPKISHDIYSEFAPAFKNFDECHTLCGYCNALDIDEKFIEKITPWKTFNQKIYSMILTV